MELNPHISIREFSKGRFKKQLPGRKLKNDSVKGPSPIIQKTLNSFVRRTSNENEPIWKIKDVDLAKLNPFDHQACLHLIKWIGFTKKNFHIKSFGI